LTAVSYQGVSGVPALAPISFAYDAAGNRLSMSDGTGSASYVYDSLSRMTSETRNLDLPNFNHSYTIGYGYSLSGGLTSITDPSGALVSYNYDSAGRLASMSATGYSGVTNFLSNTQYRAFGAMKHATYGNSVQLNLTYNARMQLGQYQVIGVTVPGGTPTTIGATMSYYADGRTNTAFDLSDNRFDRKYEFDFSARLKEAYSGVEAHGAPAPPLNQANSPYRQTYTYDEWNNATSRTGRIWAAQTEYDGATYSSDNKHDGWSYDAAGNATFTGYQDGWRTYDVAGRPVTYVSGLNWKVYPDWPGWGGPDAPALETEDTFDGAGQLVKHINHTRRDNSSSDLSGNVTYLKDDITATNYYLHSTVLRGKTIAELDQNGVKTKGYVYSGSARIATQDVLGGGTVFFECTNPVTGAAITTDVNGAYTTRQEPDPLGRDLTEAPAPGVANDPLGLSKWNEPMPIEASWGPSQEYLNNNAGWANTMDLMSLRQALRNEQTATWQFILQRNPNIGIRTKSGQSLSGADAVNYLSNLPYVELQPWGTGVTLEAADVAQQNPKDGVQVERRAAQTAINILRDNEDCRNYIRKLLNNTGQTLSLDPATTDFGMGLEAYIKALDGNKVEASGISGKDKDGIAYGKTYGWDRVKWNKEFYDELNDFQRGVHTIHEALHQIPELSDQVLATAAARLAGERNDGFTYDGTGQTRASKYLQQHIEDHCGRKENIPAGTVIIR
jgi:YD repeat-containing protein